MIERVLSLLQFILGQIKFTIYKNHLIFKSYRKGTVYL